MEVTEVFPISSDQEISPGSYGCSEDWCVVFRETEAGGPGNQAGTSVRNPANSSENLIECLGT